jgi:predicted peptidase
LFEAHTHESGSVMPYRLYRPRATGRHPLVVYLHGSGGLGTDNLQQLMLGNVFGTRLWVMPEHQARFPCFILVPQTDRGWMRYGPPAAGDSVATLRPGLGEGARLVFEIIETLVRTHPIDPRRLYIAGQSMGGGGVWHMTAQRPHLFAAAVICCGVASTEPAGASSGTPLWNFHGAADPTVPIQVSRRRIEELRKAGGRPIATEYEGVGHNVWLWAFTEPALLPWVFAQRRSG